ncbi:MAG: hypothetical protein Q7J54_03520 [Candidatus Woesearchaeota archaeon]|nr:hypothetical protein [Candidatus Woesearchaeota archaeon]
MTATFKIGSKEFSADNRALPQPHDVMFSLFEPSNDHSMFAGENRDFLIKGAFFIFFIFILRFIFTESVPQPLDILFLIIGIVIAVVFLVQYFDLIEKLSKKFGAFRATMLGILLLTVMIFVVV